MNWIQKNLLMVVGIALCGVGGYLIDGIRATGIAFCISGGLIVFICAMDAGIN